MSEQDGKQASILPRPTANDNKEVWKTYWKAQGQPWRTEPEIDVERQAFLTERRNIKPDIMQGIYPFKDIKVSRADVEWLMATHEKGRGPVDWSDESQREREGLDLRGANLCQENLSYLPLARMRGCITLYECIAATTEQINMAVAQLQGADLNHAQLQGVDLRYAQLQGTVLSSAQLQKAVLSYGQLQKATLVDAQLQKATLVDAQLQNAKLVDAQLQSADLTSAQLQGADLWGAQLQGADLTSAQLQGADLWGAQLQGADLQRADLENAKLDDVTLSDQIYGSAHLADIRWGEINLAVIDWGHVTRLGDEQVAQQEKDREGEIKDKQTRIDDFKEAVRANRQLAVVLREQGLNEEADHFAYRAQVLQRKVFWLQMNGQKVQFRQTAQSLGKWLFSWFLNVAAGYGYKPLRCFLIYLLALLVFTLAHYIVGAIDGHSLSFLNAIAVSVQSLHGRLFSFQTSDPQTVLNTIEAFVGLFIEAIVVAVITQRILGK